MMTRLVVMLASGVCIAGCSADPAGPPISTYDASYADQSASRDVGAYADIVIPDTPPGFYDVPDFLDGGVALEGGFELDAGEDADAGDDADAETDASF
jgi:hypothetical protein